MAIATFVPSLDEAGWVNTPLLMGDRLLSYFFIADYSQTELYNGNVSSLPYLITEYQGNLSGLLSGVTATLQTLFSRYFNNVIIETNNVPNTTNSSLIGFSIYIAYTGTDGVTYTLSNIIEVTNSLISNIINIING
jgi:hypothetical protein